MEGLTRLVSESLARHGFDRPLDYRRLHWSRWFRCESHHSLLVVPSKPGVFALAEEITHVATVAKPALSVVEGAVPRSGASGSAMDHGSQTTPEAEIRKPEAGPARMLAVTQFFEADDMAFVLDRMLSSRHPMRARLESSRYFVRFVVIEDQSQRHSIASALNQWMVSAAEKATGIGSHFASSLELTPATEYVPPPNDTQASLFADCRMNGQGSAGVGWDRVSDPVGPSEARQDFAGTTNARVATGASTVARSEASGSGVIPGSSSLTAPQLDSGAATNIHCPSPLPSGF
jgi:hypothetical protein